MNFHDKKEIPSKYIYLFLAVVCFILLFFSVVFENHFSPLKTITSAIITPMQTGINEVGTSIYNKVTNKKEKETLLEENKALQDKLDEYSAEIKKYEQDSYELTRLQDLLALKEEYANYDTVGARVIATDSTNWFYTFIINKGTDDGIEVGCNVLAGNGLAGIVTEVGKDYAKVRSIIDDNSNVPASVSGTETLCTVSGDLASMEDGYINVGYINKQDTIEEGAELVTSHVSDKFLPGLLIGYISDVKMDANNLTQSAKCIPVVDFNNLQEVLVILVLKENFDTDSNNKNIYDSVTKPIDESTTSQGTTESSSTKENSEDDSDAEATTQETTSETTQEGTTQAEENDDSEEPSDNGE